MEDILLFSASVILSRCFFPKGYRHNEDRTSGVPACSVPEPKLDVYDVAVIGLGGHGAACISHLAYGGMKVLSNIIIVGMLLLVQPLLFFVGHWV